MYYGLRNIPVYTIWTKNLLQINRKTFGLLLNISAKEVYYIELGRIPAESTVKRLVLLHRLAPVLSASITIYRGLRGITARIWGYIRREYYFYRLWKKKLITREGQLLFDFR